MLGATKRESHPVEGDQVDWAKLRLAAWERPSQRTFSGEGASDVIPSRVPNGASDPCEAPGLRFAA